MREEDLLSEIERLADSPFTPENIAMLADLMTVHMGLYGQYDDPGGQIRDDTKEIRGNSEFLRTVRRVGIEKALKAADELVGAVNITNPKLYESFMRRLSE